MVCRAEKANAYLAGGFAEGWEAPALTALKAAPATAAALGRTSKSSEVCPSTRNTFDWPKITVVSPSATAAAITPLRNYFENFSRFTYTPINGVTSSYAPRATYGYCAIIDATTGAWSFFRYTTNGGNTLTGVKRLGSTSSGDYLTTLGDVTWGTAPYLTAADGNGFQGVSEGAIASGSVIYETNSKGVPLCFGLGLGEMALVAGYGKVPINGGASFKTMANRTNYYAPHGQAFANGDRKSVV